MAQIQSTKDFDTAKQSQYGRQVLLYVTMGVVVSVSGEVRSSAPTGWCVVEKQGECQEFPSQCERDMGRSLDRFNNNHWTDFHIFEQNCMHWASFVMLEQQSSNL